MSEIETPPLQPVPALQALEKHLREQKEHGVERVHLSAEAQTALNSLGQAVSSATAPPPPPTQPAISTEPAPAPAPAPAAQKSQSSDNEKRLALRNLYMRAKACRSAPDLGTLHERFVFATGNPDADLMFVGEAPGAEEEQAQRPFVGLAGELLDKIVAVMGLERDNVYLSNILKYRPLIGNGDQGNRNRRPTPEEIAASVQWVFEEIKIVQPKIIVALGGTAMKGLLGLDGSPDAHRSHFHDLHGVPVMVTYHPSFLLKSGEKSEKRKVWEDLLLVMEKLEMPISAKQRSFFL